ncbi:MAG: VWA domain-containing protein [Pyrinomonadaceae bacterium]
MKTVLPALQLFTLMITFMFAGNARAQDDVIKIDTDLQTFDVTATDAAGKFVRGLSAKDFKIYEDGQERAVEFFEQTQKANGMRPIAIVFALDISGSVRPDELGRLRDAMRVFIARLADKNASFAITTFGMNVRILQSFTNDGDKLEKAYDKLLREPSGLSTHTYDAVDDAVRLLDRKAPRYRGQIPVKKSIIVVTDGFPVGDTVASSTVIERANKSEISIFTVTLPSFSKISLAPSKKPLPTPLDVSGLAEKTGGKNVYATDKDFEPLFRSLAEDVTASYLLAFYPAEEKRRDGRFHSVKIEIVRKDLIIRQNRVGYTSTTNSQQ